MQDLRRSARPACGMTIVVCGGLLLTTDDLEEFTIRSCFSKLLLLIMPLPNASWMDWMFQNRSFYLLASLSNNSKVVAQDFRILLLQYIPRSNNNQSGFGTCYSCCPHRVCEVQLFRKHHRI